MLKNLKKIKRIKYYPTYLGVVTPQSLSARGLLNIFVFRVEEVDL